LQLLIKKKTTRWLLWYLPLNIDAVNCWWLCISILMNILWRIILCLFVYLLYFCRSVVAWTFFSLSFFSSLWSFSTNGLAEYFQNKLVDTIHFMEILNLKDSVERDTFFRKLPNLAEQLPRQIVLKKVTWKCWCDMSTWNVKSMF